MASLDAKLAHKRKTKAAASARREAAATALDKAQAELDIALEQELSRCTELEKLEKDFEELKTSVDFSGPVASPVVASILAGLPREYATSTDVLRKVEAAEAILRELRDGAPQGERAANSDEGDAAAEFVQESGMELDTEAQQEFVVHMVAAAMDAAGTAGLFGPGASAATVDTDSGESNDEKVATLKKSLQDKFKEQASSMVRNRKFKK